MSKNHILITGASSAIGCAIIRLIADESTVLLAHYSSNLEALVKLRSEVPGQVIPIQADLSAESGILSLIEAVSSHCEAPGKIILLAAPRLTMVRFKDLGWEDFRSHVEIPLRAAVMILGQFLPKLAKTGYGRVVFMLSSVVLGVPPSAMAHYVVAKYAMLGLMKATAGEFVSKGITVNAVAPSMVETGFLQDIPGKLVEIAAMQHPLKRNATPGDVAPLVKCLISDEMAYLTGVTVPLTGGLQFQ